MMSLYDMFIHDEVTVLHGISPGHHKAYQIYLTFYSFVSALHLHCSIANVKQCMLKGYA